MAEVPEAEAEHRRGFDPDDLLVDVDAEGLEDLGQQRLALVGVPAVDRGVWGEDLADVAEGRAEEALGVLDLDLPEAASRA